MEEAVATTTTTTPPTNISSSVDLVKKIIEDFERATDSSDAPKAAEVGDMFRKTSQSIIEELLKVAVKSPPPAPHDGVTTPFPTKLIATLSSSIKLEKHLQTHLFRAWQSRQALMRFFHDYLQVFTVQPLEDVHLDEGYYAANLIVLAKTMDSIHKAENEALSDIMSSYKAILSSDLYSPQKIRLIESAAARFLFKNITKCEGCSKPHDEAPPVCISSLNKIPLCFACLQKEMQFTTVPPHENK
jgi:hypothetical protein